MIHDGDHERWLERILVGELDERSTEARRALAACPECQAALSRVRRLEGRLAGEAERQRADLELARASTGVEDERLVRLSLERVLASPRHQRRGRRLPVVWLAAAAVLLALLGWLAFRPVRSDGTERQGEILLGGSFELRFDPATGRLDWDGPARATFEIEVWTVRDGRADVLLLPPTTVFEPAWHPSPEEIARLPAEVFVMVRTEEGSHAGRVVSLASISGR